MEQSRFFAKRRNPLPGGILFDALYPPREMILAANTRVTREVIEGILQAAKDTKNIVILELALHEMNTRGGYCGMTPRSYAERVEDAARRIGWYGYVLHADHMTVEKGTASEIANVKKELNSRIDADFSSFAVDTSFLFKRRKSRVEDQLEDVIKFSVILFKHLKSRCEVDYGKEGEVGEIGIEKYTTVSEALYYLESLGSKGIDLDWLAIANGSRHGVCVDCNGRIVPKTGINVRRTSQIASAISKRFRTRIAQHGTTGTPISFIAKKFPKGSVSKCNVGTHWMLLVWDVLKRLEPRLYSSIYDWTIENYADGKNSREKVFAKNSKYAIGEFFEEIDGLGVKTKNAIRSKAYRDTISFFRAMGMKGTAKRVGAYIESRKIRY